MTLKAIFFRSQAHLLLGHRLLWVQKGLVITLIGIIVKWKHLAVRYLGHVVAFAHYAWLIVSLLLIFEFTSIGMKNFASIGWRRLVDHSLLLYPEGRQWSILWQLWSRRVINIHNRVPCFQSVLSMHDHIIFSQQHWATFACIWCERYKFVNHWLDIALIWQICRFTSLSVLFIYGSSLILFFLQRLELIEVFRRLREVLLCISSLVVFIVIDRGQRAIDACSHVEFLKLVEARGFCANKRISQIAVRGDFRWLWDRWLSAFVLLFIS